MTARNAYEVEMNEGGAFDPLNLQFGRRDFLKLFGSGLLIALAPTPDWAQESGGRFGGHELPKNVSAWLHIAADSRVTVFTGKVEVGQNIRTSLAQQVAEELRTPFDSITMVMGDTARTPWDMGTFGSRTTPTMGPELRKMSVAARQTLIQMAAERWQRRGLNPPGRRRQSHRPRQLALSHLRRTHRRQRHRKSRQRRRAPHARHRMEDRRHRRPQSRPPRLRHRQASLSF